MRAQPALPAHVASMNRGQDAPSHTRLAAALSTLRHDPTSIPLSSQATPLLP
ncbi:hypothetical protein [Deinococcus aluminii]|uniref:Uncharacterized protein n=1 Tax=Deinococcus aluminii TaxID=1656885 RepID=A0ABP9XFH3_9DEIO